MIEIDDLYFNWLMAYLGNPSIQTHRLCVMLEENVFQRRVGNDINRAKDGLNLRAKFLSDFDELQIDPRITNEFLDLECSWLEMMIALAERLDYMYDGGLLNRFMELIENLGLTRVLDVQLNALGTSPYDEVDKQFVDLATARVDQELLDMNGHGGLFPLSPTGNHPDQRGVEIWAQHAAYFRERLEGVMWTSTS